VTTDPDKLHIAVDLDDVTVDFFQGNIDAMYREFGVLLLKEDVLTWDDNPVKLFPWKDYGYKSWWEWLRDRDWLWATFPAVPGAMGGIHALRAKGHYVECLTSKPDWAERQVWAWLTKWKPAFQQVTLAKLDEPKHTLSQADILIDDKFSNITDWVDSAEDRLGILFDQPWNRFEQLPERVVRVVTWQGVLETIELMEVDA
jgi:5'(3')-deoxyribonucleotidase